MINMTVKFQRRGALLAALALTICFCEHVNTLAAGQEAGEVRLIPQPREIQWMPGKVALESPVGVAGAKENPRAFNALCEVLSQAGLTVSSDGKTSKTLIALGAQSSLALFPKDAFSAESLPAEGYYMQIAWRQGTPTIALAGNTEAGTFYAVQTLRQLLGAGTRLRAMKCWDYPAFARERGYGEFFYGKVWTHEQRMAALKFMAETKMNFYMYSPKDDPYNRDKWREDYPEDQINRMKEILAFAHQNFITFSFAMNPGLSIKYSDDKDFEILMRKYERVRKLGVRNFSLQIDDIGNAIRYPEDARRFKNQGEAHAFLINRVYNELKKRDPGIEFSTCGMMYYIAEPDDYTRSMGQITSPDIPIMWTGGEVVDDYISISEARSIAAGLHRKPFLSDNYPVNDFAVNRLFMGPLTGRPSVLVEHLYNGFLENPMNQEEASKIGLATVADYAWNPYAYNSEQSWDAAIRLVAGDKGYAALRLFCENNRSGVMEKRESIELASLIRDFNASGGWDPAASKLREYLERMKNLGRDLRATVPNAALLDEIKPWVEKIESLGGAMLLALEIQNGMGAGSSTSMAARRGAAAQNDPKTFEARWSQWLRLRGEVEKIKANPSESCGPIPSRLIDGALAGWGLGVALLHPSCGNTSSTLETLDALSTHTIALMSDGDSETCFHSNRPVEIGDYVAASLTAIRPVREIHIDFGNKLYPYEYIHSGRLEYTIDGTQWTKLADIQSSSVSWSGEAPLKMSSIRAVADKDQPFAMVVREFSVRMDLRPRAISELGLSPPIALDEILDGRPATSVTIPPKVKENGFIELQLGDSPKRIFGIALLMDAKDFLRQGQIQFTTDGAEWIAVGDINKPAARMRIRSGSAKAIRLVFLKPQENPIKIYEFSVIGDRGSPL